jgi:hypothetical protein
MRGRLTDFSIERLFRFLGRLDQNVRITVSSKPPSSRKQPTLRVYAEDRFSWISRLVGKFPSFQTTSKLKRSQDALMQKKQILRRRRLTTSVRKRITSYYTETEQQEIATAASAQSVSLSSFIASAALKEARAIHSRRR